MIRRGDPRLPNRHHLIMGRSGCGKSTWLRANKELAGAPRRVLWDPDEEHRAKVRAYSLADLVRAYQAAGNGRLDVALTVPATPANFDLFCRAVWAYASCDRVTYVLAEELSSAAPIDAKVPTWELLCTRSRKYGVRLWAVTHSPVGINRAIYRQAGFLWLGALNDANDVGMVARLTQVPVADVEALVPEPERRGVQVTPYLYGERGRGFTRQTQALKIHR